MLGLVAVRRMYAVPEVSPMLHLFTLGAADWRRPARPFRSRRPVCLDGLSRAAAGRRNRGSLEKVSKSLWSNSEVVIEASGNCMTSVTRGDRLYHVKTGNIDAGTFASPQPAGCLPQIWTPDASLNVSVDWRRAVTKSCDIARIGLRKRSGQP